MLRPLLAVVFASVAVSGASGGDDPFSEFSGETSVSLGYGYAENVLYSELAPVDSAFVVANVEAFFERTLFSDFLDWNTMLFLDHRSFQSAEDIPEQTLFLLQTQVEGYAGLYSKWRVGSRYLGLEQAFDATFDELERNRFLVKAKEPELLLGWESFFWRFEYDAELGFSRMSFEQEGSDYDSLNWQVDVDQQITDGLSWESGIFGYDRDYLERSGRDLRGVAIADSRLGMTQIGFETGLSWLRSTEAADHKVSLMLSERDRSDAQVGYYDRKRQSLEFRWQARWDRLSLLVQADYGEYRYENQTGEDGFPEATDSWSWSVELDRKLNERWGAFLWLSGEREDSNASFSSYDSRSVSIGMKWLK